MATVFVHRGLFDATISFRYNPGLVELTKTLPSFARSYDRSTKCWTIHAAYVDQAVRLFESHGHTVIDDGPTSRQEDVPPSPRTSQESWADALLDAVGADRVDRVHKALTRVLHPDVGGSNELMGQLNAARDRRVVRR